MKNHLKNLPSTKNPTRLIYGGLAIWCITKIAYQLIEGWHWHVIEYSFEYWLIQASNTIMIIGLFLHRFSFEDILTAYRKRMLKNELMHKNKSIELEELIEEIQRENIDLQLEKANLLSEVELYKNAAKGQQQRADQATSFGKTMEAANSILLQTQGRLNKTADNQDKTIKLLVKSQLEVINNLTSPQIVTQEYKPEVIRPVKSEGSVLREDH